MHYSRIQRYATLRFTILGLSTGGVLGHLQTKYGVTADRTLRKPALSVNLTCSFECWMLWMQYYTGDMFG